MKKILLSGIILSVGLLASEVVSEKQCPPCPVCPTTETVKVTPPSPEMGKKGYVKCIGCHGGNGEKKGLGKSAVITGQDAAITAQQLKYYGDCKLNKTGMGSLMKSQVSKLSDEEIEAIAAYISQMK